MRLDFTFEHPWALYLAALCVPYLVIRFLIRRRRAVAFPPLQFHRPGVLRRGLFVVPLVLEAIVLGMLAFAAAGPHSASTREFVSESGADIALCLDVSLSMQAADIRPSRLEALKAIASDFVKRQGSGRIGIYAFAGEVFTQTPLTSDRNVILEQIDGLSFESIDHSQAGGSAIGDAMVMAAEQLVHQRIKGRGQAIILFTDGENNGGIDPHIAARLARDNGIHVYVVCVGGDRAVPVLVGGKALLDAKGKTFTTKADDTQLKEIARTAEGKFWRAGSSSALQGIFAEVGKLETSPLKVDRLTLTRSYRPYVAMPLLLVFAAWLGLEGLMLRRPLR
jgi:Ca-activated chloride channel family protein